MAIALIVPVYKNFEGFTRLMASVDQTIYPIVIPNYEDNIGVSAGWNVGLREASRLGFALSLICNDDTVLQPGTINKLVQSMTDYDLVTAINMRDKPLTPSEGYSDDPDFSCFMVWTHDFGPRGRHGEFDENFTPAYFEDNDMHYRIKMSGRRAVCRTDAGHYHQGSVTQNWGGQQVVTGPMFIQNQMYYVRKWGGTPGWETHRTPFDDPKMSINEWSRE